MADSPQRRLEALVVRQLQDEGELALQACAVVDGEVVAEVAGGVSGERSSRAVDADSLFPVFSVTKGIVAAALLTQLSRGTLALGAPVCEYWPAFGRHGKDRVTVGDVLVHAAGIPQMPSGTTVETMCDWKAMTAAIEALEPLWPAGQRCGYHAYTFGWIAGELLKIASGKGGTAGEIARELICGPAQAEDLWIGTPEELHERIVEVRRESGPPLPGRDLLREAIPPPLAPSQEIFGLAAVRSACLPAVGGIATARSVARIYSMLACNAEAAGIAPAWTQRLARAQRDERDAVLGTRIARSLGFYVSSATNTEMAAPFESTARSFGHPGSGGALGWAEPELRAGFAITRSRMTPTAWTDRHVQEIVAALRQTVAVT